MLCSYSSGSAVLSFDMKGPLVQGLSMAFSNFPDESGGDKSLFC